MKQLVEAEVLSRSLIHNYCKEKLYQTPLLLNNHTIHIKESLYLQSLYLLNKRSS